MLLWLSQVAHLPLVLLVAAQRYPIFVEILMGQQGPGDQALSAFGPVHIHLFYRLLCACRPAQLKRQFYLFQR